MRMSSRQLAAVSPAFVGFGRLESTTYAEVIDDLKGGPSVGVLLEKESAGRKWPYRRENRTRQGGSATSCWPP